MSRPFRYIKDASGFCQLHQVVAPTDVEVYNRPNIYSAEYNLYAHKSIKETFSKYKVREDPHIVYNDLKDALTNRDSQVYALSVSCSHDNRLFVSPTNCVNTFSQGSTKYNITKYRSEKTSPVNTLCPHRNQKTIRIDITVGDTPGLSPEEFTHFEIDKLCSSHPIVVTFYPNTDLTEASWRPEEFSLWSDHHLARLKSEYDEGRWDQDRHWSYLSRYVPPVELARSPHYLNGFEFKGHLVIEGQPKVAEKVNYKDSHSFKRLVKGCIPSLVESCNPSRVSTTNASEIA